MVASLFAGFNMIYYSVREILGEPVSLQKIVLKDAVEFKRYWGGVGIAEFEYAII